MSIKFGEIDSNQILDNEYLIKVTIKYIDKLIDKNANFVKLTPQEFTEIKEDVLKDLKEKYPNSIK